jgi:hypothetical protein
LSSLNYRLKTKHSQILSSWHGEILRKAQAAQCREISSPKCAAQKHSAEDTRVKQKVHALKGAVKQAIEGCEDVKAKYAAMEAAHIEQEAELADTSCHFKQAQA